MYRHHINFGFYYCAIITSLFFAGIAQADTKRKHPAKVAGAEGTVTAIDIDGNGHVGIGTSPDSTAQLNVSNGAKTDTLTLSDALTLKDGSNIVGVQVARSEDCQSGDDSCSTCKISGTWDMCNMGELNIDMDDHNPEHIICKVYPDDDSSPTGTWKIDVRIDHKTSGYCNAVCLNLTNSPNSLDNSNRATVSSDGSC